MRGRVVRFSRLLIAAGFVVAGGVAFASVPASPAAAQDEARAEISINPAEGLLTVTFTARSSGFPTPVVSYSWAFGDGKTATTTSHTVTHTYRTAGRYMASVTESDAAGTAASASGTIALFQCPTSQSSCTESLTNADGVQDLQASGPISGSSAAGLNLFVGPFRISHCQLEIVPTAALTDAGFTGNLTVTLDYTSSFPTQARTTCFSSTVPFVDSSGKTVTNGRLPMCAAVPTAPCVESVNISGSSVTKDLLIPPGDPKVGAP